MTEDDLNVLNDLNGLNPGPRLRIRSNSSNR